MFVSCGFCNVFFLGCLFGWLVVLDGFAHQISLVLPLEKFSDSRKIVGDINDYALAP